MFLIRIGEEKIIFEDQYKGDDKGVLIGIDQLIEPN
jgi:hypothetical protein